MNKIEIENCHLNKVFPPKLGVHNLTITVGFTNQSGPWGAGTSLNEIRSLLQTDSLCSADEFHFYNVVDHSFKIEGTLIEKYRFACDQSQHEVFINCLIAGIKMNNWRSESEDLLFDGELSGADTFSDTTLYSV